MQARLAGLQANNANPNDYANELKKDVAAGLITPDQAAQLMKEYLAARAAPTPTITPAATTTPEFAALQQRALAGTPPTATVVTPSEFAVPEAATEPPPPSVAATNVAQETASRIAAIEAAMGNQASQLVNAWAPPTMEYVAGDFMTTHVVASGSTTIPSSSATSALGPTVATPGHPIIKAGTVLFAVLDTAINSDFKSSPVMATIVQGPYKGARVLGQLYTANNAAGQLDRVGVNFTLMNFDAWSDAKQITAYAIDPDTARAVFASHVNNHYFKRFGAIMASSFLQGFGNAIATSGSTSTTGIFGTSTTKAVTSTSENIWQGLGQVGQTFSAALQPWINIPPTVRVDPGVGLGILFMADVTQ